MTAVVAILHLADVVASRAAKVLIADRRRRMDRTLPLSELVDLTVTDDYKRRHVNRELEAIRDSVAKRLEKTLGGEWASIPEGDRTAAFDAALRAFESVELSDEFLFAHDAQPVKLARSVREHARDAQRAAGLSVDAAVLYERTLDECCTVFAQLATHYASYAPRAITELLDRTTSLSQSLDAVLARLPQRSLLAPQGDQHDADFRYEYLSYLASAFDTLELFGVDTHRYRPDTKVSVAYISLSAQTDGEGARRAAQDRWQRGELLADSRSPVAALRIEQAIAESPRSIVRAEAGSGKTTLLRWLAVTAARGDFKAELAHWNGHVPFLITLRGYAGSALPRPEQFLERVAPAIAGLAPEGWTHRQLHSGKALILVDGVDELPADERASVREWIRGLLTAYPQVSMVVTSRPSAATRRWLAQQDFTAVSLERMGPSDVRQLVAHWHSAVRDSGDIPCTEAELPEYERQLLAQLDANQHLQGLATNPLLCAMLCALNLDRRMTFPRNRMDLYKAAIDMLLERRDAERGIASQVDIDSSGKLKLLQYLAWRLSLNNRSELLKEEAVARLEERLNSLPSVTDEAGKVLEHLTQRSGIIREPVIGRVDFIHRTFQEYLTALECAEQGDVGLLVEHSHLDSWREIVVMAAGHANRPTLHGLLTGILSRAADEGRFSRRLSLLAASCLETCGPLDASVLEDIEGRLAAMLPPRRRAEARSLASARLPVLRLMPTSVAGLSPAAAMATISTVALIGGADALDLLSRYADDNLPGPVSAELVQACQYYDAVEYGTAVLSKLSDLPATVRGPITTLHELRAWQSISDHLNLGAVYVHNSDDIREVLRGVETLRLLWINAHVSDLSPLTAVRESLKSVYIWSSDNFTNLASLSELTNLSELILSQRESFGDLEFLAHIPWLRTLWLPTISAVRDFTPLTALLDLESVRVYRGTSAGVFKSLSELSSIAALELYGDEAVHGYAMSPYTLENLDHMMMLEAPAELSGSLIDKIQHIGSLNLYGRIPASIEPLRRLRNLRELELSGQRPDLSPLLDMPSLEHVTLSSAPTPAECRVLSLLPDHVSVIGNRRPISRARLRKLAR
ncbi:MAG: hypothetical protein AUG49_08705 [Catenulispora sp. 13_1_20CM_3_70_7]|nr:MAG: hypothetical protein AUG49_08705 [Catenulispora sp. 13_1_20CM_3_70_7]